MGISLLVPLSGSKIQLICYVEGLSFLPNNIMARCVLDKRVGTYILGCLLHSRLRPKFLVICSLRVVALSLGFIVEVSYI
jgi:hypothetical protein